MQRRVVVTGMGVLSSVGTTLKDSWQTILSGKSCISKLDAPEYATLPCRIAGLIKTSDGNRLNLQHHFTKSELRTMSPATCYALLAAQQALDDANLSSPPASLKDRIGVAVGMGMADLADICATNQALAKSYNQVSPFFMPRILTNMAAGQISIRYGFRGPNHAVSTACATGAHAIGDSFRFIRHGDAEIMVCGGAEACVSPLAVAAFCRLRALSTSHNASPELASRPFDKAREGFVMGEGSAILVLEELTHARGRNARIYAEVVGYGLSGDAAHLTAPRPDGTGALLAMQRALGDAGVAASEVGYVNAHATSTPIGDAVEVRAIRALFGDHVRHVAVSSTKGAHGHLLGGSGNLESVFAVKAVEEGVFPPTVNLEQAEDEGVNFVPKVSQEWKGEGRRIAVKNAFGFGGTNASLCIAQYL